MSGRTRSFRIGKPPEISLHRITTTGAVNGALTSQPSEGFLVNRRHISDFGPPAGKVRVNMLDADLPSYALLRTEVTDLYRTILNNSDG